MITPAIEQSPTSLVDTLCEKAEALLEQNNIDGVEALASEASARDPACNRAHQLMVRVALIRGEQDRAQTLLNRWRDLPVDDAFAEWGVLAEEMNDIQSAVEIYQAHLSQHPHNARASFGLAMLHAERNENGLAQSRLQTLIQHHADHIEGIFELARLYEEDGMMGLAQELYARVLELDPDHAGARAGKQLVGAQLQSSQTLPDATLKNHPDIAALILRLFAARKDVYARQWIDEDGKTGYVPVREPLTEKAFATAHLVHIERHVLKCVFGHLDDRGRAFLHTVIGACADYKTEVTDYQIDRLHPHPIGCPKIRKHLPELVETVPCNCEFDLPEGGYPSPLLHIDPAFTAGMGRVDQPQNRETVDRYVTLRQQAAKVMADLSRVEDEMRDLLRDRKGKISTGVWVVTADDTGRLQIGVEAA